MTTWFAACGEQARPKPAKRRADRRSRLTGGTGNARVAGQTKIARWMRAERMGYFMNFFSKKNQKRIVCAMAILLVLVMVICLLSSLT